MCGIPFPLHMSNMAWYKCCYMWLGKWHWHVMLGVGNYSVICSAWGMLDGIYLYTCARVQGGGQHLYVWLPTWAKCTKHNSASDVKRNGKNWSVIQSCTRYSGGLCHQATWQR